MDAAETAEAAGLSGWGSQLCCARSYWRLTPGQRIGSATWPRTRALVWWPGTGRTYLRRSRNRETLSPLLKGVKIVNGGVNLVRVDTGSRACLHLLTVQEAGNIELAAVMQRVWLGHSVHVVTYLAELPSAAGSCA